MSKLKTNTLETVDGTKSVEVADVAQGVATAWAYYDKDTQSMRSGYNISSITRTATGETTVTFASPMDNEDFIILTTIVYDRTGTVSDSAVRAAEISKVSNTEVEIFTNYVNEGAVETVDYSYCITIFGGKA